MYLTFRKEWVHLKLDRNEEGKFIGKGYFVRKASDLRVLLEEREYCERKGVKPERFVIEKVIDLSLKEYEGFCMELLEDNTFVKNNVDLMKVGREDTWHCILVRAEPTDANDMSGILINAEGHDYARYSCALGQAAKGTIYEGKPF